MSSSIRVLICRTDGLGDNLLSLPVANDLKTAFPSCRITWMANETVAPLISMDGNVDEVLVWDGVSPADYLEPSLKGNFDAAVVLHPKPKEWLPLLPVLRRAGIPIRVGTGRRWWGLLFYTHRVWASRHSGGMHESTRARRHGRVLLESLMTDCKCGEEAPRTGIAVPESALVDARAWISSQGLKRPVILHVGSNGSSALWPIIHMAQLADRLEDSGYSVLISTGFRRPDLEIAISESSARSHVFTPAEPGIEQLAALFKTAGCVVSGSTGPLHLASALGAPTVGLFPCVKDCLPAQWGALGERAINLVAPTPPSGMYRRRRDVDSEHMQSLSVDSVMEAVRKQLSD